MAASRLKAMWASRVSGPRTHVVTARLWAVAGAASRQAVLPTGAHSLLRTAPHSSLRTAVPLAGVCFVCVPSLQ